MTKFNNEKIIYLEAHDIKDGFPIMVKQSGIPMMIMLQGDFCGHCKEVAKDYMKASETVSEVLWATVQLDGEPQEQEAAKELSEHIKDFIGVPHYVLALPNGEMKTYEGNRSASSLIMFIRNNI